MPQQFKDVDYIGAARQMGTDVMNVGQAVDSSIAQTHAQSKLDKINKDRFAQTSKIYSSAQEFLNAYPDPEVKALAKNLRPPTEQDDPEKYHAETAKSLAGIIPILSRNGKDPNALGSALASHDALTPEALTAIHDHAGQMVAQNVARNESGQTTADLTGAVEQGRMATPLAPSQPPAMQPESSENAGTGLSIPRQGLSQAPIAPQTKFDMTAPAADVASQGLDSQGKPVSSTDVQAAGSAVGAGESKAITGLVSSKEKQEALNVKEDTNAQLADIKKTMEEGKNTRFDKGEEGKNYRAELAANSREAIAAMRKGYEDERLSIDRMKAGTEKLTQYLDLYAKYSAQLISATKANEANKGNTILSSEDQNKNAQDLATIQSGLSEIRSKLGLAGVETDKNLKAVKKPLTPDIVSQAKKQFGTDKSAAKKWLKDQGYDVK
jgi:hypothetical protein